MTGPVIDLHCHVAGLGAGGSGCRVTPRLQRSWRYRFYLQSFGVSEAELSVHGDRLLVERLAARLAASQRVTGAVLLALDGVIDARGELDLARTEVLVPDTFLAEAVRPYPQLRFAASVNPWRRDALERLEQAAGQGAVLLKWLPNIQGIDPADRRLRPFYRRLAELGLPLLSHTGSEASFTRADQALGDPARLRLPLEEGVTVIAAHGGGNGRSDGQPNLLRLLELARQQPRLYTDCSSLTQANRLGMLPRLLEQTPLAERVLYGSDMPLIATPLVWPLWHLPRLGITQVRRLTALDNCWDRDVALKEALGLPAECLSRGGELLGWRPATTPPATR